jgi:hypothetical protein
MQTIESKKATPAASAKPQQKQPFFAPSFIQPKLTINEPGDKYEQEADAMADRVMRMSAPTVQRKCTACEEEEKVQREKTEEEKPVQTMPLMRKAEGGYTASPQLTSQLTSSKGGGSPLPGQTLASMNQAFGADFSKVRIHTGSQAAEMSQGIQAKAFTHGSDIYFNRGQYSPESSEGKRLLGHELTHVVQQGNIHISRSIIQKKSAGSSAENAEVKQARSDIFSKIEVPISEDNVTVDLETQSWENEHLRERIFNDERHEGNEREGALRAFLYNIAEFELTGKEKSGVFPRISIDEFFARYPSLSEKYKTDRKVLDQEIQDIEKKQIEIRESYKNNRDTGRSLLDTFVKYLDGAAERRVRNDTKAILEKLKIEEIFFIEKPWIAPPQPSDQTLVKWSTDTIAVYGKRLPGIKKAIQGLGGRVEKCAETDQSQGVASNPPDSKKVICDAFNSMLPYLKGIEQDLTSARDLHSRKIGALKKRIQRGDQLAWAKGIYKEYIEGLNHQELVEEVKSLFARDTDYKRFPLWNRYMVLNLSGVRYAAVQHGWKDPSELLRLIKEKEIDYASHSKLISEFMADPLLKKEFEKIVATTFKDKAFTKLDSPELIALKEKYLALIGVQNTSPELETKLAEIDLSEKVFLASIPEKSRGEEKALSLLSTIYDKLRRLLQETNRKKIQKLGDKQVLSILKQLRSQGSIPDEVWKEIVQLTPLRLEVDRADWETERTGSHVGRQSKRKLTWVEADKLTPELKVWKGVLDSWISNSSKQKISEDWLGKFKQDFSAQLISQIVCDQLGAVAQTLRGVRQTGGLRSNIDAYTDITNSEAGKKSGAYFKQAEKIEDFQPGASIFYARWVSLDDFSDTYGRLWGAVDNTNLKKDPKTYKYNILIESVKSLEKLKDLNDIWKDQIKKLEPHFYSLKTNRYIQQNKVDIDAIKSKIDFLLYTSPLSKDSEKKVRAVLKQIDEYRGKLVELETAPVYNKDRERNPYYDNTVSNVIFQGRSLMDSVGSRWKDSDGWTYSIDKGGKRAVDTSSTKDSTKNPVNIMRVKINPFFCKNETECPLNFDFDVSKEDKEAHRAQNRKLLREWLRWSHQATVMYTTDDHIFTFDTSAKFDGEGISGMGMNRLGKNDLINMDPVEKGFVFVGYAPEKLDEVLQQKIEKQVK